MESLPDIAAVLDKDITAAYDGDPAARSREEVMLAYPAFETITIFRLAHRLFELGMPLLPRMMTEYAHSRTGIDIHPGATIGEYFAIDHGTGVVIGETAIIGSHVTLYQGVTLGAKSFRYDENGNMLNIPRHPIIEDYVTVYSNASILGRITIGHHSVIGGNIWVTNNVPPHSRIQQSKAVDMSFQGGLGI
jgi:serine O-acetyltransferase